MCQKGKREWLDKKASEAEEVSVRSNSNSLCLVCKELSSLFKNHSGIIKAKDGRLLTSEAEQWQEHFNEVLNQPDIYTNGWI